MFQFVAPLAKGAAAVTILEWIQVEVARKWRWKAARYLYSAFRVRSLALSRWAFRYAENGETAKRTLFGSTVVLDVARSDAQRLLYVMGPRFLEERSLVAQHVRTGMTVVDIGANIGYYALLLRSLVGSSGSVVCIEPSPENLPELHRQIEANGFENIEVRECAVGRKQSTLGVRTGINAGMVEDGDGIASVNVFALSELLRSAPDFIKIDVDGFEMNVLVGSHSVLVKSQPTLLLEVHPHLLPRFGSSCSEVYEFLNGIYGRIQAFHTPRPESLRLSEKLKLRLDSSTVVEIVDVEGLVAKSDAGDHQFTFWLLCQDY